jgi:hypothetical protein
MANDDSAENARRPSTIPVFVEESLDPDGRNPFPEEDPRHRTWATATLIATQGMHELNAYFLQLKPLTGRRRSQVMSTYLTRFDVWADRRLSVISESEPDTATSRRRCATSHLAPSVLTDAIRLLDRRDTPVEPGNILATAEG